MTDRLFRYYKEDFGKIPVRVIHMDLVFDVFYDHTQVTSDLHVESHNLPLSELALNAKNLEILTVRCPDHDCSFQYNRAGSILVIRFGTPLPRSRGSRYTRKPSAAPRKIFSKASIMMRPRRVPRPSRSPSASNGGSSGWSPVSMT